MFNHIKYDVKYMNLHPASVGSYHKIQTEPCIFLNYYLQIKSAGLK